MEEVLVIEKNDVKIVEQFKDKIIAIEHEMKILKEQQEIYKKELLEQMEKYSVDKIESGILHISHISQTYRETFDSKRFKEEHEDLYNEYVKVSQVSSSIRVKVDEK